MARTVSEKECDRFISLFARTIKNAGGVLCHEGYEHYAVQTRGGKLRLYASAGYSLIVFCRFDDPQAARAVGIKCNPWSGKWNHHYSHDTTAKDAADDFAAELGAILPEAEDNDNG